MNSSVNRVAIVGCGLIGRGWASWLLTRGVEVTCTDPAPGIGDLVVHDVAAQVTELGYAGAARDRLLARLHFEPVLTHAVASARWIQECVPEDAELKRTVLAHIDKAAAADTVIASSTSSLTISDLQRGLNRPERLVAGHPFLPVTLIPLIEVSGGRATADSAIDTAMAFYRSVGKRPIRLRKEMTGHIANRLQAAILREAFFLLQEGVASASDIDLAMAEGPAPRWVATGPFVSQHLAGGPGGARQAFANLGEALRTMWADLGSPCLTPKLQELVVAGTLESLAERSAAQWQERRRRLVRAIELEKTRLDEETGSR